VIAEFQMNQQFNDAFGETLPDFPLKEGGHIYTGNTLRHNWLEICPPPKKTGFFARRRVAGWGKQSAREFLASFDLVRHA